jgi:hypothetical protein
MREAHICAEEEDVKAEEEQRRRDLVTYITLIALRRTRKGEQ